METVELRVHGVHGTSPGAMLGVADGDVGQVAGDGLTGIYRAKDGVTLPYRDLANTSVSVEAYSWGALTSGVQGFLGWLKRVLWLALLPFALVNLAYWARLELARDTARARWGARAVRVSGLLLTVFFVLTPCVLAMDLGAWQCFRYGVPSCSRIPTQLDFLARWSPGQRLAGASLVPMLALGVLWLLSKKSLSRYEETIDPLDSPPALPSQHVLLHPKLWNGTARTLRLQRYHLTAGTATVVAFSGVHLLIADHASLWSWRGGLLWVTCLLGFALLLGSIVAVTLTHPDDVEPLTASTHGGGLPSWQQWGRGLSGQVDAWVLYGALGVYAAHVLALAISGPAGGTDESLDFIGRNTWFVSTFVLLTLLHLAVFTGDRMKAPGPMLVVLGTAIFVLVIEALRLSDHYTEPVILGAAAGALLFWVALAHWHYQHSPAEHEDKAWRGAGASVLLATAAWIALLFTSSTVIAVANYLNGPTHGVGDLVSQAHDRTATLTQRGLDERQSSHRFLAQGAVTLRRAVLQVDGSEVTVSSGTVETARLSLTASSGSSPAQESRGRTVVNEVSTLAFTGPSVSLADSCLGTAAPVCTAEDATFHTAATLPVRAGSLKLAPGVALAPASSPQTPLAVPQVLIWTPMGQLLWLALVVGVILGCVLRFLRRTGRAMTAYYDDDAHWDPAWSWADRPRCLAARRRAALAHRAEKMLDKVGTVTSPVALLIIVFSISGETPWQLPHAGWTRSLATASMLLVVALSSGLILLGSQIRRSEKTRKTVGVLWDLTTFWPRAAHPLAPPCYAERVIPELQIRTRWVLDKPGAVRNEIIVSGHSQGSLIVLAMVSRLNSVHLGRVRMVTYGSQIRALYGRVFPRVFGPEVVGYSPTEEPRLGDPFPDLPRPPGATPGPPPPAPGTLRQRLALAGGHWVNLFRRTDPLGWRVFSDLDSDQDLPVPEVPPRGLGDPGPVVLGHGGYQHSLVYRRQVSDWTGEPLVPDPVSTTQHQPVLPPL